jgi:hypothetical protein
MHTLRMIETTGTDGVLHVSVPLGKPQADFEVVLVLQPKETKPAPLGELGWPEGYFDNTFGSITDETFQRPPQGELPKPMELD